MKNLITGNNLIMSYKVYVVGPQKGYASWMEGSITSNMEEADVVLFTGGEDINPNLYGDVLGQYTGFSDSRDRFELEAWNKATKLNKVIFGTCRGAQLSCAMAGGRLVQHLRHPSTHRMTLYDNSEISTNSLHHQLQYPYTIPSNEYYIIGYSEGLSKYHLDGNGNEMPLPAIKDINDNEFVVEPEFIYYKKVKSLSIQGHPEMMNENSSMVKMCRAMLKLAIAGTLELALNLKIPVSRLVDPNFTFTLEELQLDGSFNGTKEKQEKQEQISQTAYGV